MSGLQDTSGIKQNKITVSAIALPIGDWGFTEPELKAADEADISSDQPLRISVTADVPEAQKGIGGPGSLRFPITGSNDIRRLKVIKDFTATADAEVTITLFGYNQPAV